MASTSPRQGAVRTTTPSSARTGQASARRPGLRRAATVNGPRNSTATAVPSGPRSIAARNITVTSPVLTPSPRSAGTSRRRTSRSGGRARATKTTAPMLNRSQAVPAGPTVPMRSTESADPSWTDSIAATAIAQGGTRGTRRTSATDAFRPAQRPDAGLEHRQGEPRALGAGVGVGVRDVAGEADCVAGVEGQRPDAHLALDGALLDLHELTGAGSLRS